MNTRRTLIVGAIAALFSAGATPVWAQAGFPSKPITFIVPFAPGGATDLMTRLIAQKMSASMGQSVVVNTNTRTAPGATTSGTKRAPFVVDHARLGAIAGGKAHACASTAETAMAARRLLTRRP